MRAAVAISFFQLIVAVSGTSRALVTQTKAAIAGTSHRRIRLLADYDAADQSALLGLKAALAPEDAAQLTGWQPGTDQCQGWKGVYCNDGNRVYLIDLSDLGLSGALSDAVDFSPVMQLQSLWLHGNRFTGTLPSSLSRLERLSDLKVYDNQLAGTLPAGLAGAARLKQLYLNKNRFSGSLPDAWSSLVNLEQLFLDSNVLAGTVPATWSSLSKLSLLSLHNNPDLWGCLPAVWFSKQPVVQLDADETRQGGAAAPGLTAGLTNTQVCGGCSDTCTSTAMPPQQQPIAAGAAVTPAAAFPAQAAAPQPQLQPSLPPPVMQQQPAAAAVPEAAAAPAVAQPASFPQQQQPATAAAVPQPAAAPSAAEPPLTPQQQPTPAAAAPEPAAAGLLAQQSSTSMSSTAAAAITAADPATISAGTAVGSTGTAVGAPAATGAIAASTPPTVPQVAPVAAVAPVQPAPLAGQAAGTPAGATTALNSDPNAPVVIPGNAAGVSSSTSGQLAPVADPDAYLIRDRRAPVFMDVESSKAGR